MKSNRLDSIAYSRLISRFLRNEIDVHALRVALEKQIMSEGEALDEKLEEIISNFRRCLETESDGSVLRASAARVVDDLGMYLTGSREMSPDELKRFLNSVIALLESYLQGEITGMRLCLSYFKIFEAKKGFIRRPLGSFVSHLYTTLDEYDPDGSAEEGDVTEEELRDFAQDALAEFRRHVTSLKRSDQAT